MTRHLRLFGCAVACVVSSGVASAESCTDYIALSRQVHTTVYERAEVENAASTFCSEYKKTDASTRSTSFGAAYKVLSASFGDSGASESAVYNRYCSATSSGASGSEAYATYLNSIAPDVYPVVKTCLELQSQRKLLIVPSQIGPTAIQALVKNDTGSSYTAKLAVSPTGDVTCEWGPGGTVEGKLLSLRGNQTTSLSCTRRSASVKSWVTIFDSDSTGASLSIPWGKYDNNGDPVDAIAALSKRVDGHWSQLNGVVLPFEADRCPNGWAEYKAAYGKFIRGIDRGGDADPDGVRKPGSIQQDEVKAHNHSLTLQGRWGDKPGSAGTYWGSDDGGATQSTAVTTAAGGKETRPKNVALLYCRKDSN